MPSGSAELMTTCESRTGIDSPSSILRCCRTATSAADLDGAALVVEEPEAVAAAGGLQGAGLADQLHAVGGELRGEGVDVGRRWRRRRRSGRSACRSASRSRTTYCSGRALGGQEGEAGVAVLGLVRPQVSV